jgi:hypothetical protein
MSSPGQNFAADPPHDWTRTPFDEDKLKGMEPRPRSELETDRDLAKPIEQLVCDYHEEIARADANPQDGVYQIRLAHGLKRMVSMMGQVALSNKKLAESNDKLQRQVLRLTRIGVVAACAAAILAAVQAVTGILSVVCT